MNERTRWLLIVLGCGLWLGILLQIPQLFHVLDARFEGILVSFHSEESVYLARVQEALSGRPEQAAEAFVGDPALRGSQFVFLETMIGSALGWTGWRAPTVLQIGDTVVPMLLFVVLWMFFRLCGFTRRQALTGSLVFSLITLSHLGHPIHPRLSTLLTLLALCGVLLGVRDRSYFGLFGGFLLGTLVGISVWSWTFAWAWWGLLLLWYWGEWMYVRAQQGWSARLRHAIRDVLRPIHRFFRRSEEPFLPIAWQRLLLFGGVGVLAAWPHVWHLVALSQDPLYEQAVFRSGQHAGGLPESLVYSILFTTMLATLLLALRTRYHDIIAYRAAAVTIAAAFVIVHQQFVSHSVFFLCIAALSAVLLWWNLRGRVLGIGMLAACVFLAIIAYDGRSVLHQFRVEASAFTQQHLASALPVLDALPRTRILSDPETQHIIAGWTQHDIVFSVYLNNVLLPHRAFAERFCLSVLPVLPEQRSLETRAFLSPDAVSALDADPSVRARELSLVRGACRQVDRFPDAHLRKFGVRHVLWNEKTHPDWDVERLGVELEEVERGEGWSLWKIPDGV